MRRNIMSVVGLGLAMLGTAGFGAEPVKLPLVPWPKTIRQESGALALKPAAKIVAATKELLPLGHVLTEEIARLTGLRLAVTEGAGQDGDIVLALDPTLAAEGRYFPHALTVGTRVVVRGVDYAATAQGTASLLQLLQFDKKGVRVPRVTLTDCSPAPYPGLMLDIARQKNTLEVLKDCVNLCRLYKVRYFHLHLNDMESFVFPSKLFPKLGSNLRGAHGGPAPAVYPREQLEEFLRYADERGVSIVPELETVFHTGSMMADMPDVFGGPGILNQTSEKMYGALEPLIGEMCDFFKSSPFFHIGCDEAGYGQLVNQPTAKEYMEKHGLKDAADIYRFHIQRLNQVIKAHGKRTIVWQDCPLPPDKDIIVMAWRIDYDHGPTPDLIKEGRSVIQVTWTPSVNHSVNEVYDWRAFDRQVKPGPLGFGSQMVLWESAGPVAVQKLRFRMPPRQERTYSPEANRSYEEFSRCLAAVDARLDALAYGLQVEEHGLRGSTFAWLMNGGQQQPVYTFSGKLEVALVSWIPGATVRYTLDGSEPTNSSPAATAPILIEKPAGEVVKLRAALWNAAGKTIGTAWSREYLWQPFDVAVKGTMGPDDPRFNKMVTLAVKDNVSGGLARGKVGGAVDKDSPVCDQPLVLTNNAEVQIRCFKADGAPLGALWKQGFSKVDYDPDNLTFHKPVTTQEELSDKIRSLATDGVVNRDEHTGFSPGPKWLMVDLEKETALGKVTLYTYWDGGRSYRYTIELSRDGKTWTMAGDGSQNSKAATANGYTHEFPRQTARYIKVTMISNSANPGLHVVEVRAWPPSK